MDDLPPLPVAQGEPLLRGPLILTCIARPVFGFIFFTAAILETRKLFQVRFWPEHVLRSAREQGRFIRWHTQLDILAPFALFLLDVVLTVLFFKRRQAFRPLMLYYSAFLLVDCWADYALEARHPEYLYTDAPPSTYVPLVIITILGVIWIPYYWWSRRVRRIFVR